MSFNFALENVQFIFFQLLVILLFDPFLIFVCDQKQKSEHEVEEEELSLEEDVESSEEEDTKVGKLSMLLSISSDLPSFFIKISKYCSHV